MRSLALYVIFLSVGLVENQEIRHMLFHGRHHSDYRHTVASPVHSQPSKLISPASPVPPDPVKHTSVALPAPPDPVKPTGVAAPVHSHLYLPSGGGAPVHSHPAKHTSVASPGPPDPVQPIGVAAPAPLGPVKHSGVAAPVYSHPLKHSGGAAPVHSIHQNGKAVSPKTNTKPPKTMEPLKPKPQKPQAPPKPKYLINRQHNTPSLNPGPISPEPAHHQMANLPAVLEAVDHLSYFQKRSSLSDSFGLSSDEKFIILKEFNQLRQDSDTTRNMNVLRWNETLAERAAAEINSCLYFNKGNGAIYAMIYEKYTGTSLISEAVGRWADEKNKFRLSVPCTDVKACRYSQIVWAETREVGCARQTCNDMSMVACMYDPPGNVIGEQAYKPGRACSRCAPGSRCNTDNLCEW
ncbi:uncharacterized protein LOC126819691 isoform X3 [Patella vulgata]|uniref:uncharacterized protein LOC126819691 isoform X3 n=1 Tax=Patella vulgata TaxID=6465 RepID=UPI00217F8B97|nr:uncharacterized protein LOC126819691 isoform X3 [Patella vulgata]